MECPAISTAYRTTNLVTRIDTIRMSAANANHVATHIKNQTSEKAAYRYSFACLVSTRGLDHFYMLSLIQSAKRMICYVKPNIIGTQNCLVAKSTHVLSDHIPRGADVSQTLS